MNILHIAAHLGGGVGKAHASLCAVDRPGMRRRFLLLEEPQDNRYADAIRASGADIVVSRDPVKIGGLVAAADIVQIEWWNHPRLYECLSRFDLPPARTILWSHISGLFPPCLPSALLAAPHRFLFTSACSLEIPAVRDLAADARQRIDVINSGFGFDRPVTSEKGRYGQVGYLGTVDFSKLSPLLFDVIDAANLDRPVAIWGGVEPEGAVLLRARCMQRPDAVRFQGHAADPATALRNIGIFLYLLQPRHFGTAENALVEAMSLGCVPLVLDNPAERAIVEHGVTGFIEPDIESVARRLQWMIAHPTRMAEMGQAAARAMTATRSVRSAAADFASIYDAVLHLPKRRIDFAAIIGDSPAEWFLSTGASPREAGVRKGTLAHFLRCFPDDPALRALFADQTST